MVVGEVCSLVGVAVVLAGVSLEGSVGVVVAGVSLVAVVSLVEGSSVVWGVAEVVSGVEGSSVVWGVAEVVSGVVEVDTPVPATCLFCGMMPSGNFSALMVAKPKEKRASIVTARQRWARTICCGRMMIGMRIDTRRVGLYDDGRRGRRRVCDGRDSKIDWSHPACSSLGFGGGGDQGDHAMPNSVTMSISTVDGNIERE